MAQRTGPERRASSTRTTTRSSACRGPRRRPTSRRPSASSPASTTRTRSPATRSPSGGSRRSTRPTRSSRDPDKRKRYDELGANWDAGPAAPAGGGDPFGRAGRSPGSRATAAGRPGGVRYEFRTTGDAGEFSDFFRVFFGEDAGRRATSLVRTRPRPAADRRAERSRTSSAGMGLDGAASAGPADRRPGHAPRPGRPREAIAEITLEEAYHGTDPPGRRRGQASRGHDPARRGHRDPRPRCPARRPAASRYLPGRGGWRGAGAARRALESRGRVAGSSVAAHCRVPSRQPPAR